jgi:ABC-type multidrug transport system ATPase subunit
MMLETRQLRKEYGETVALNDVSLEFTEGVYGILGVNGSGKSTLFGLLSDNIAPSAGTVHFDGERIASLGGRYRSRLGFMPQQQGYYEQMSALVFLRYVASLKGLGKADARAQIEELLSALHLREQRHEKMKALSGGMKQRVMLAQALLGEPSILLLDEPTAGLDPEERIRIRNYISSIARGKIILIATHIVSDVEMISKRVIILEKGKVKIAGTTEQLVESIRGKVMEISRERLGIGQDVDDVSDISRGFRVVNVFRQEGQTFFRIVGDALPSDGKPVEDKISLEDIFMYYSNRKGSDDGGASADHKL